MKLKELAYQQKAVAKLTESGLDFLKDRESYSMVFQAPTGSGKTVVMAEVLSALARNQEKPKPLSFIWISVNSLHEQSRESLERFFEDEKLLTCSTISEIDNTQIQENEVLFVNWESLNKTKNIFIRDNERDWNLEKTVENTKEEGREIILIIDESHRAAKTSKATELIDVISPKLTIEVSATPKEVSSDLRVRITLDEVIEEEMIKEEILINPGLAKAETNEDIVEAALKKRKKLAVAYHEEKSPINPLLLIQIPDKRHGNVRNPEDMVIDILRKRGVTTENGKLAIWLSDSKDKVNLDDIEDEDSDVEVLIFKQAIALGWDCPRAAILLLQREWNVENYVFNIQTLGRIMRMPEQRYYPEHPELSTGYVYTASDQFSIVEDLAADYVSQVQMVRDEERYSNIDLPSQFIRRKLEKTRLSGKFKDCLLEAAKAQKLKGKLNTSPVTFKKSVGVKGGVAKLDKEQSVKFQEKVRVKKDREEVAVAYGEYLGSRTAPYARVRSTEIIKSSLRSVFKALFGIDDEDRIAGIVLNRGNKPYVSDLIDEAKQRYEELPEVEATVHDVKDWQVPKSISVFDTYEEDSSIKKSILLPFYHRVQKTGRWKLSKPEQKFIKGLEASDDELRWWFKNGERESKFFGIAYDQENGQKYAFYPDFILKTKKELLVVEIKDDSDFKNENLLKLNAGKEYQQKYSGKERLLFYIISPLDYDSFFRHLEEQDLDDFDPKYEDNLRQVTASRRRVATDTGARNEQDRELLEEYDKELTKAVKDKKILEVNLEEAQAKLSSMKTALAYGPKNEEKETEDIRIPRPFNICVLGEVADEDNVSSELRAYFAKYGLKANEWDVDFVNNARLRSSDVLSGLKKGQSKYNLLVTGQVYHHSGKGNKSANLLTELKKDKYVDHVAGSSPKDILSAASLVESVESYISGHHAPPESSKKA